MSNICYMSAHSILEADELCLFAELGHQVFSLGAYIVPAAPHDDKRPPLDLPEYPELLAAVGDVEAARRSLPDALLEWADVIIAAAYPIEWLVGQWGRIRHKRVVWRTIGQSNPVQEREVKPYRAKGLQIVRYSPAERKYFEKVGDFAGEDALIRFAKDPADWQGWTGCLAQVGNVTQHNPTPHERDSFIHWAWWEAATSGLPHSFAGLHSELIGGLGALGYDDMRDYLRQIRCYAYMGTVPASYTLGFVEALMTGVPMVSIGKSWNWAGQELFEADEIALWAFDDPQYAKRKLRELLAYPDIVNSKYQQRRAIELFGKETIKKQWARFLG